MKTAIDRPPIFLHALEIIKLCFTMLLSLYLVLIFVAVAHAATMAEVSASPEKQTFLAATLGKGTAMKGVKSKYQEFQVQPDYAVTPKLGPKLNDYLKEFRQIMGTQ